MVLTLENVLGWGSMDINYLEDLLDVVEILGYDIDDIYREVEYNYGNTTNINNWIYEAMLFIYNEVIEQLEEDLSEYDNDIIEVDNVKYDVDCLLDKLKTLEFDPFINYLDSHFNNFIDFYIDDISKQGKYDFDTAIKYFVAEHGNTCIVDDEE